MLAIGSLLIVPSKIPGALTFILLFSIMPANALLAAGCSFRLIGHLDPPLLSPLGVTVVYFLPGIILGISGIAFNRRSSSVRT